MGVLAAAILAATSVTTVPATARVAAAASDPVATGEFTFVVVPDTQNFVVSSTPAVQQMVRTQTEWIRDSEDELNTVFTAHLGDLVSNESAGVEWDRIDAAFSVLDAAGVPYAVTPGNHDMQGLVSGGSAPHFDAHFSPSRFTGKPWYDGGYMSPGQPHYDAGLGDTDRLYKNSYQLVDAGGMAFIVVSLEYGPPTGAVNWAARVLDAHPDRRAIIATHDWLAQSGVLDPAPATAWNTVLRTRCNLFLVVSGHNHNGNTLTSGEARRTETNSCGDTVHMVMSDYQDRSTGSTGRGNLRYYVFDPAADTIRARTYNPVTGAYETDASSQFDLAYDMDPGGGPEPTAPGAPMGVTAIAGDGQATVSWVAPVSDGGSPITGYAVTSAPDGLTCTTTGELGCTVTGLANGTGYTFRVTATNGSGTGPQSAASNTVTPQGIPTNHAPALDPIGDRTVDETEELAFTATASDGDLPAQSLAFSLIDAPAGATIHPVTGAFTWTPGEDLGGTTAAFTVRVTDDGTPALSDEEAITVTVNDVNFAPVALDDAYATAEDTALVVAAPGVLANDTDIDGDTLTALLADGPSHGALELDAAGGFTYTPAADYCGADAFTYRAGDGTTVSAAVTVALTIAAVADLPGAPTGVQAAVHGATATVSWVAPASDGGAPIAGYTATSSPDGMSCTTSGALTCSIAGLADGRAYTFTVRARNAAGEGPASTACAPVTIDTTAPSVTTPTVGITAGSTVGTRAPVVIRWQGADSGSGVATYEVWLRKNDRPYRLVATSSVPTHARSLKPSATYRFRVRAIDTAGNASAFQSGERFRVVLAQQTSTSASYAGSWSTVRSASASGGSYRVTKATRASVTYRFTGRSISWIGTIGPSFGKAKVILDGTRVATVNLNGASPEWRQVLFTKSWAASRSHTLRIVGLGTDGHPKVGVDAFVVLR